MRIFRRRPGTHPSPRDLRAELRSTVSTATIVPEVDPRPHARARLLRVVSEAVVLQDEAEALLAAIRDREPLAELAPRGGPIATRFFQLREALPAPVDREMARWCETASAVLDHHGTLIVSALQMLSMDWRSQAIVEQLERLEGLGAPAERLDGIYAEIAQLVEI